MSRQNPLWGAPRIHGELFKLGIDIGETSVSKYLVRGHKPPFQSWRSFPGQPREVHGFNRVPFFMYSSPRMTAPGEAPAVLGHVEGQKDPPRQRVLLGRREVREFGQQVHGRRGGQRRGRESKRQGVQHSSHRCGQQP